MANERRLTIVLAGDHRGVKRSVDATKGSMNDLDGSIRKVGGRFSSVAKTAGLAFAGLAVGAVVVGKGLYDAAIESQKVSKQTDAVLKSMGNTAGVTRDDIEDLTRSLSEQAGIDDELIQSAQNVLLTFGKVQNKVGKGNKIFDRGTKAALDMSVALGTDMQGATIQIGKALNDPIKGITALSRAGVSFTEKQKLQIKTLVAYGDTLGAQKIILGELENQFGGSAAAQATAGERLSVVWGNIQEDLGAKLIGPVETAASWLSDKLPRALEVGGEFISTFWSALTTGMSEDEGTPIESVAIGIHDALEDLKVWWDDNGETIKTIAGDVFGTLGDTAKSAGTFLKDDLLPPLKDFGTWLIDDGPGAELAITGIAGALALYASSAVIAAGATLVAMAPFIVAAVIVGTLAWATGELVDKFNLLPKAGTVLNDFTNKILVPFLDVVESLVSELNDLIDNIKKLANSNLSKIAQGGAKGLLPDLTPGFDIPGIPLFDSGGVMPGPRGQHSLAWVAGGETVLPTHQAGQLANGEITLNFYGNGYASPDGVVRELKRLRLLGAA